MPRRSTAPARCARFWLITLPLMGPWIFFVIVIDVIGAFQVFTQVLTLTNGGPDNSTTIAGFLIEQEAFQFFNLPYAAAISTTVLFDRGRAHRAAVRDRPAPCLLSVRRRR